MERTGEIREDGVGESGAGREPTHNDWIYGFHPGMPKSIE